MRRLTALAGGAAATAANRYKGHMRWLALAPLLVVLHVVFVVAWVLYANPFAALRPFGAEAEWGVKLQRAGGDPGSAEGCRTVLVPRMVLQPTLILGDDGQLRVEDRKVRQTRTVKRCP